MRNMVGRRTRIGVMKLEKVAFLVQLVGMAVEKHEDALQLR